ncbi:MAG: hypothetical protein IE886_05515 [Campylobacterales bacterium]|nr:hypothetical protein [Campylobacterales bacterium]
MSAVRGEDPSTDDCQHTFSVRHAVAADTGALTALEATVFSADNYPYRGALSTITSGRTCSSSPAPMTAPSRATS